MILARRAAIAQKDSSWTAIIFLALPLVIAPVLMEENYINQEQLALKDAKTVLAQMAPGPAKLTKLAA